MDFFHNPYRCGPLRVGMYGSHGTCRLQKHVYVHLLLFKTERVLSAIQQTSFCQLWVISTNYEIIIR